MAKLRILGNDFLDVVFFMIFLLVSLIPIFAVLVMLSLRSRIDCGILLEKQAIGLLLFTVFVVIAGAVGLRRQISWLICFFMIMMVVVIGLVFSFSVTGWMITQNGGEISEATSFERGYYKYWDWNRVKTCLKDEDACRITSDTDLSLLQYNLKTTSYIQSGCCKPPPECGFTATASTNPDCSRWSNSPGDSTFCFDCQSCKAGVFADLKKKWRKSALVNIISISFTTVIYILGCWYLFKNRRGS